MIDKIKKTLQEASELIKDQANQIGESAKEKTFKIIEEWLEIFPKLEAYGFEITSFSLTLGLSPSVEAELYGKHESFPMERVQEIIEENPNNRALNSVFTSIRTTYRLYMKTEAALNDPLLLKIRINISPEIKVYIGEPKL